jgi:hypothetical protein
MPSAEDDLVITGEPLRSPNQARFDLRFCLGGGNNYEISVGGADPRCLTDGDLGRVGQCCMVRRGQVQLLCISVLRYDELRQLPTAVPHGHEDLS